MENNQNMEMQNAVEAMGMTSPHARRKQKIILAAVLAICMAIFASGTLAYFTAEETAHNVITTGVLSMDLIEETTGGQPWPKDEEISGVMPGTVVDKIPYMVNNGGIDFYARMYFTVKVTGADGKALSDEYISLDVNRTDWTEKDGCFYYNAAVKPGEQTKPLFTKVTFSTDMPNAYMNARIEIDVYADAVQSKNNTASAQTAAGWREAK